MGAARAADTRRGPLGAHRRRGGGGGGGPGRASVARRREAAREQALPRRGARRPPQGHGALPRSLVRLRTDGRLLGAARLHLTGLAPRLRRGAARGQRRRGGGARLAGGRRQAALRGCGCVGAGAARAHRRRRVARALLHLPHLAGGLDLQPVRALKVHQGQASLPAGPDRARVLRAAVRLPRRRPVRAAARGARGGGGGADADRRHPEPLPRRLVRR
mmetsp:Transcript_14261/g.47213  ORF Transcript_14261/g.47213 Transcript_14261/m.47213 type:complete len:218 (+) Transcript_14261:632-1285(+)